MTRKLCEIFNELFGNAISNLNIPEFTGNFDQSGIVVSACTIINATAKYENRPSVTKIRNKQASSVPSALWKKRKSKKYCKT